MSRYRLTRTRKTLLQQLPVYFLLALSVVVSVLPFIWMISTSLKEPFEVFKMPPEFIPERLVWRNYTDLFSYMPFHRFILNSVLVSSTVTISQAIACSMAAFSFARLKFRGRDVLFFIYLSTLMVPYQVTLLPNFLLIRSLGWLDTYKALIIPGLFGNAFGTFLLRQFFLTLPRDLEDAAKIDGCNIPGIFRHVIIPLSKPALSTLGIFTFMSMWNEFIWPLVMINSQEKMTLPLGLSMLQNVHTTNWQLVMAGATIALVPVLLVFVLLQRYIVEGITLTGLKA